MRPVPEQVLLQLLDCYGIAPHQAAYLGGGREDSDGVTYSCKWQGTEMVFKILALDLDDPRGITGVKERIKFVRYLGERGARIVCPQPLPDGSLFATCRQGDSLFLGYMMKRVQGRHPSTSERDEEFLRRWGATVGQIHRLTREYPIWREYRDLQGRQVLGWQQEWEYFHGICKDPDIKQKWEDIRRRLQALPVTREAFGLVHNDPHIQNLLYDGEEVWMLDFDVANCHWFINDVAVASQSVLFEESGGLNRPLGNAEPLRRFFDLFLQGYKTENHLDPAWLQQLDLFVAYRRILLFVAMQDWLAGQAKLRNTWKEMILEEPHFISEQVLKSG